MSKIKKIITVITGILFVMLFYELEKAFAFEIPSATGDYSMLNFVPTPAWLLTLETVGWGLLLFVVPVFVVLGIFTFRNMKEQEKIQRTNPCIDNEYTRKETAAKFKRIVRWIIIISVIAIGFIIATIIISNTNSYKYKIAVTPILSVNFVIIDIVVIAFSVSRDKATREIQQMHQHSDSDNNNPNMQ
jgi:magnesium-transporting ATPase (P-type)